ncbi:bone morphogenetic protein receptor type-2 [Nematolebias whitei]|uniref:bone morphogenetic protein receptor type-2 n=1 Tax=Nematolebias whitei TaxID=451745 RepID=UPI00189B7941|nr:bone morphogenetic protein receptor type-2 [Nematolebias whitei]
MAHLSGVDTLFQVQGVQLLLRISNGTETSNMSQSALMVCVLLLLLPAVKGFQSNEQERLCAFSNSLQEAESVSTNELRGEVLENGTIRCSRGSRCYGLWEKRKDGEMKLLNQGCWTHVGHQQECLGRHCILETATPSQIHRANYHFCCCSHDLCNSDYTEAPPTADSPALKHMRKDDQDSRHKDRRLTQKEKILVALVTVSTAAIVIMALFLGYRVLKRKQKLRLTAVDGMEAGNTNSAVDFDNLKLMELIGRGRYGAVFRGSLKERLVAVKVFSSTSRQNFSNERSVYSLPLLQQHQNIARFLGADERTAADGQPEFLILMEFYPHGSLSRFLSVHTVDWLTCCRMTHGVTRGLSFLHSELDRGDQYKPAVAHRDLTSRNVLVRSDLSCVLADFGLSMKVTGARSSLSGDDDTLTISEVGTVRYMAPELLGGALNLRDCESALKQVDVYALGLLYWESFRRCSDLFPGDNVPEYQLAFQAEVGNCPSVEDMQFLVVQQKLRPGFPEAWKENSPAQRSLKETIEDCWDQDSEARLTAQCAEERLVELTLLSSHTMLHINTTQHNHRNLSNGCWTSQFGSASSYIEDLQVDMVRNLQGDRKSAPVVMMTSGGVEGVKKNWKSINSTRQQEQVESWTSDDSMVFSNSLRMDSVICTVSESQLSGGARTSGLLQLTEEDLEATKLDPKEVQKNLRDRSEENLMEHSQKQFGSEPQTSSLLDLQTPHRTEGIPESFSSIQNLLKQQNLPQRPTCLHLQSKPKEIGSVSSQLKQDPPRKVRQVETGVAKMNTVKVGPPAEPHLVTTVTNMRNINAAGRDVHRSCSAGVPTLVTNWTTGDGRTNPAGPQEEEEEVAGMGEGEGGGKHLNLLHFSPDEEEPLLEREQLPAETEPPRPPQRWAGGHGPNSNNNNNRLTPGSELSGPDPEPQPETKISGPGEQKVLLSGPAAPQAPPTTCDRGSDTSPCQEGPEIGSYSEPPGFQTSQEENLVPEASCSGSLTSDTLTLDQKPSPPEPAGVLEPHTGALEPALEKTSTSEPLDLQNQALDPQILGLLQVQLRPKTTRRPERPCSLDLSCLSSGDGFVPDSGSLSATGEKIKRRVKTPYTLKKWRPASWVVSADSALDLDFEFSSTNGGQIQSSSSASMNQSKSSMAVFLVGGGATATTTSDPDRMTQF